MANCFKRLNALSLEDFTRLSTFFHKMYDFNPVNRVIDIEQLLNEYENILLEIGILTRLGKSFQNNSLVNKPPAPPVIMAEAKKDEKSPPEHLSQKLQEFANKDPIILSVKCPSDKEINPITKRCVKKCKEGYERDDKFKCKSVSKKTKIKSVKSKSVKICPEDKELNPKTNRCVKKCPNGYLRDENFKCKSVSKQTRKITRSAKSKSIKVCPSDKELNPKTNRCVKKCPNGYTRNDKFECRKRVKTLKHPLMSNISGSSTM